MTLSPILLLLLYSGMAGATNFFSLSGTTLAGKMVQFSQYQGKVALVVNVASKWGFTNRDYSELSKLQTTFSDKLAILAFPCNQFGEQEPGTPEDIQAFAAQKAATFTMFEKCDVKGKNVSPVFAFLKEMSGKKPLWNFTKYLVAKNGVDVSFYPHNTSPADMAKKIQKLIDEKDEL